MRASGQEDGEERSNKARSKRHRHKPTPSKTSEAEAIHPTRSGGVEPHGWLSIENPCAIHLARRTHLVRSAGEEYTDRCAGRNDNSTLNSRPLV